MSIPNLGPIHVNGNSTAPAAPQPPPTPAAASPTTPPSTVPTPIPSKKYHFLMGILRGERKTYIWLLLSLLSLIAAVHPSYILFKWGMPIASNLEDNISKIVEEVVPEELTITIKDGRASTNVTEPYYLTISRQTLSNFIPEEDQEENAPISRMRLLAIDTQGSAENLEKYQSMALLTATSLTYYDDDEIKIQPLSKTPDMEINRTFINKKIGEISKNGRVVTFVNSALYASPLFIFLGLFLYYLLEVLMGAFIIWVMNKIMQTKIRFGHLFKLSGILYLMPALFLMLVSYIPGATIYYKLFYTALDVALLAGAYVLIKQYKSLFHE